MNAYFQDVKTYSEVATQIDVFFVLKKLTHEHWKFTYPPTLLHWKKEMGYYWNMERSVATEKSL